MKKGENTSTIRDRREDPRASKRLKKSRKIFVSVVEQDEIPGHCYVKGNMDVERRRRKSNV